MLGICDVLRELGDIRWRGFVVTAKFDEDIAMACKRSGCYEIASGIESGSEEILRRIRKPATVRINRSFIQTAKRAGLRVKAFMIVGLAGESWDTIRETDRFLEDLRREGCAPDDVDFSILQIYPGSPFYQNPQDIVFKDISEHYEKAYYKSTPGMYEDLVQIRTGAMSAADLLAARNYLEDKYKPPGWVKEHGDRRDLDRVYESIRYAEKKDDKTTTLILNGTHLDVIQMNNSDNTSESMEGRDMDMSNNASQQNSQPKIEHITA